MEFRETGMSLPASPDLEAGTPEMQARAVYKPLFETWLLGLIGAHGKVARREAINGGAHVTGASQETIRRYLDALTSGQGPLMEITEGGRKVIVMRTYRRKGGGIDSAASMSARRLPGAHHQRGR